MIISIRGEKELQRLVAQISLRIRRDMISVFLSEMGIQRLEAVLDKAKLNRQKQGHNDYDSLATVWLEERKKVSEFRRSVIISNPYRTGSKLFDIFFFMADGERHSLVDITNAVYSVGAGNNSLFRRRVASALRTIRRQSTYILLDFDGSTYRLSD